jgi:cbb3-type cytochrome oxidase subunit 3
MFEAITAWATVVMAICTIVSIVVTYRAMQSQVKNMADALSAELALKLTHDFDSEKNKNLRGRVSHAILNKINSSEQDDLFDIFEQIGLFVRKGLIDAEIAHSLFFHWVNLYWVAGQARVKMERNAATTLWSDFEYLYEKLLQIEMTSDPHSRFINPSDELIRKCLEEEEE